MRSATGSGAGRRLSSPSACWRRASRPRSRRRWRPPSRHAACRGGRAEAWSEGAWRYRAVWGGVLLTGVGFGVAEVQPIPAIILAQALNGLLLPFVAIFLLVVVNDAALMGRRGVNGAASNTALGVVVAVTVVLGALNLARAGAAGLGVPAPSEALVLVVALLVLAALAIPVAKSIRRRRREDGG